MARAVQTGEEGSCKRNLAGGESRFSITLVIGAERVKLLPVPLVPGFKVFPLAAERMRCQEPHPLIHFWIGLQMLAKP